MIYGNVRCEEQPGTGPLDDAGAPKQIPITWWQQSGGKGYRTPAGAPCDSDEFLGDEAAFAVACDPTAEVVVPLSVESA